VLLGRPERSDRQTCEYRARSGEAAGGAKRMAAGTLVVRQRTLVECMKKRRAIAETDSDEERRVEV
jgi:hypothetical protein